MAKPDAQALLAAPIFRGLAEARVDRLLEGAAVQRFKAGSTIAKEGEIPRHLHVLRRGMVELSKRIGRRRYSVLILSGGDLFMPAAALFGEPYLVSARALTSGSLVRLEAGTVRREVAGSADLGLRMTRVISGQWRMAIRQILDLKGRSAPSRLATLLLRFVDDGPTPDSGEIPFAKRHLAARVGMTAETLSRALQLLAEHGLVVRGHRIRVTDRRRIEKFCGPDPYPRPDEAALGVHLI
jgi:CRP/FNR family transcriptional activator FtrB